MYVIQLFTEIDFTISFLIYKFNI